MGKEGWAWRACSWAFILDIVWILVFCGRHHWRLVVWCDPCLLGYRTSWPHIVPLTGVLMSDNSASWHIRREGYLLVKIPRTTMGNPFLRWRCNTMQGRVCWRCWNGVQGVPKTAHYRLEAWTVCTVVKFPLHLTPRRFMICSHFHRALNVPGDIWTAFPIGLKDL